MADEKVPCFKRGVDPEGNPWCDFQGGHDGLCSDHVGESMGRFVVWRESDVDDSGNVRPLAVSDVVNPPGESSGSDGPRITSYGPESGDR